MESTRNGAHAEITSIPFNTERCTKLTAAICLVVANVAFFGSVFTIVWLFQNKLPYKYAVVCFMVGSGMLYIVAFTSTLLLLTSKLSRSRSISRDPHVAGLTSCVQNEGCDAASDISYRGASRLLQLPQMVNAPKTPPPPYKEPSEISTSQSDMGQVQTTQDSNNSGNSQNPLYYELNKDDVQQRPFQQEYRESESDIEMQTMSTSNCITGSSNSYPVTRALRQQMASKSQLIHKKQNETSGKILQKPFGKSEYHISTNSENSPRSALKVKRNPSQAEKRKLKAMLSMSHSDLHSGGSLNSRPNLNLEGRSSRSDCNGDTRSLHFNSQGLPRILVTNAEVQTSQSILNLGEKQRDPRLDCNEEIRSSQSNLNSQGTPRIPRSNPEVRTSFSNLNPQGSPRISRSNAGAATSQIIPSSEERLQASRLDWKEEAKSSLSNLKSEGTPRFSRSNIVRTSQMNLIPEAGLQAFQSRLNVDRSSSNLVDQKVESFTKLNYDRKKFDSTSNYIVPTDRRITSHSNLHLNAQQSNSNSTSFGMQRASQMDMNSNAFLNIPYSNMVDADLKHTSQPVQLQKVSQPQQFEACSKDVLQLQKAQSFTSLSVSNPLAHLKIETLPQKTYQERLPSMSSSRQMSGRSIESVLDATRNSRQLTPQEWTAALNHSFLKMPKESERVSGVRM